MAPSTAIRQIAASGCFALASLCSAEVFYVSSSQGSDSDTGLSAARAWRTLDKVKNAMAGGLVGPGDTVLFRRGDVWNGTLQIVRSGESASPLIVDAYGEGPRPWINASGRSNGLEMHGRSHLIVRNLAVSGARDNSISIGGSATNLLIEGAYLQGGSSGIRLGGGSISNVVLRRVIVREAGTGINAAGFSSLSDIRLEWVESTYNRSRGLYIGYGSNQTRRVMVINSKFNNNAQGGLSLRACSDTSIIRTEANANGLYGIGFLSAGTNIALTGARCWSNKGMGIWLVIESGAPPGAYRDVKVTGCSLLRNAENGLMLLGSGANALISGTAAASNRNDGFNVQGTWSGVTFERCTANANGVDGQSGDGDGFSFHNTSSGTITGCTAQDNLKSAAGHVDASVVKMVNNLFTHKSNGTWPLVHMSGSGSYKLWHNTIYSGGRAVPSVRVLNTVTADIRNNIVYGGETGIYNGGATVIERFNLVYGFASRGWVGVARGPGSMSLDPMFVSIETGDFSLSGLSPAIDAAEDLGVSHDMFGKPRYDWTSVPDSGIGSPSFGDRGCLERVPEA